MIFFTLTLTAALTLKHILLEPLICTKTKQGSNFHREKIAMLVFRALALFMSFALRQHHISLASETVYFLFLFPLSISYLNVKKILSLDRDLSEQGGFSYESVYNGPISLPYDTLITLVSCRFLSSFRQRYDPSVVFLSIRDLTQKDGWKAE